MIDETGGLDPPKGNQTVNTNVASSSMSGSLTLEAIGELLDKKLSPMNAALSKLVNDFETFKSKVREEIATMGLNIESVEKMAAANATHISKLEKALQDLAQANENLTIVIGNVPKASLEAVQQWLKDHIAKWSLPQPIETYANTDDFKGVIFAKCLSSSHRDQIIMRVRNLQSGADPKPWTKLKQPFDIRTATSTLFAIKRMLVEWGYNKCSIWVNEDTKSLSVAGTEVVKVTVADFKLCVQWCDGEWEQWKELEGSSELQTIKSQSQEKLTRAQEYVSSKNNKGKGKGPQLGLGRLIDNDNMIIMFHPVV